MSAIYRNVGPDRQDEETPQRTKHNLKRFGVKMAEALRTPVAGFATLLILAVISFMAPSVADLMFLFGVFMTLFIRSAQKEYNLPARMPQQSRVIDPMQINPGRKKPGLAKGTFYLGNDRVTGEEVWLNNRDAGVHMLVLGTTGSGKAQPLDAKVHTPSGWRLMGEICAGDFVSTPDGLFSRVSCVFPQGELDIFKVTFADGRSTEACADHLWQVHQDQHSVGYGASPRSTVLKTKEISSLLECGNSFYVPLPDPVEKPTARLPFDPYLFGLLVANHCCRRFERENAFSDVKEMHFTDSSDLNRPDFSMIGDGDDFASLLRSYIDSSIAQRIALLRGLVASSGRVDLDRGILFESDSLCLSSSVQELVRSLGGIAFIQKNGSENHLNAGRSHVLEIQHANPELLFPKNLLDSFDSENLAKKDLKLEIVSIRHVGKKISQCIMIDDRSHLYITDDYVVTHNTEMLLGLCQNALNQGSGFMFVDGKAQDKIAFKIQDLCRARGRDDDVLILNFMTGAKDIIGPQPNKITNTMNPFSYGSSGMISQLVVGLMASGGGGDDMWKDRAISFVEAISPPLTYLRDNYGLILDVNEYRKYFELDRLEALCWNGKEEFPGLEQVLDPIRNYLINLPGYDQKKYVKKPKVETIESDVDARAMARQAPAGLPKVAKKTGQGDDTKLQHGFITMQLVRAFTSLADTYGHIVRVPLGEVYFPDLVKQRRILIAMLPSLEKTPSETANIGKIIVTALKNIMAEGLGSVLEGDRNALDNEDGRALLPPYVVILDEYGYYAVKGFAVAFAQARSLGFVCVVGGQDLASFQRESKEEAVSICGNTRIKAFGSIEDPDQTMDFVVKTAGKALIAETTGFQGDMGMFSMKYADQLNIHLKAVDRIDPSDIKEQIEGQFTFVWRSRVIRATTYFVDPPKVPRVQLNHFIQVPPPTEKQLQELDSMESGILEKISSEDFRMLSIPSTHNIDAAASAMISMAALNPVQQGIAAIVTVGRMRQAKLAEHRQSLHQGISSPIHAKTEDLSSPSEFDTDEFFWGIQEQKNSHSPADAQVSGDLQQPELLQPSPSAYEDEVEENTPVSMRSLNVFPPRTGDDASGLEDESPMARHVQHALTGDENHAPLLDPNQTYRSIEDIELAMGATPEEAGASARDVLNSIAESTRYPRSIPSNRSTSQINDLLVNLLDAM